MGPELVGYFVRFHISLNDTHQGKYQGVSTTKSLEDREFQFVYIFYEELEIAMKLHFLIINFLMIS